MPRREVFCKIKYIHAGLPKPSEVGRLVLKKKWALTKPIFFSCFGLDVLGFVVADPWKVIETAAGDLGFELIDLERTPGGVLRVFIDSVNPERGVSVDDCEALSRQLVHLLPVEGIDFQRLEVSSPGLDRPLTKPEHFVRFSGLPVKLRLKMPIEGRRNFEGTLNVAGSGEYSLTYEGKGGQEMVLGFELHEIERARLVPMFKF